MNKNTKLGVTVGLLLALVFPFALFVAMSHIGRDAERQRDLEKGPKKERA